MKLSEAQILFSTLIAEHVVWINKGHGLGWETKVRFDEVNELLTERDPTSDHMPNSNHHRALAADLIMFKDGVYQTTTEEHMKSGERWESRHYLCRWGGRWGDGNHYSLEWNGIK